MLKASTTLISLLKIHLWQRKVIVFYGSEEFMAHFEPEYLNENTKASIIGFHFRLKVVWNYVGI
jgi:hypothetical protein